MTNRAATSTTCGRPSSSINCFSLGEAGSAHLVPCFERAAAEHRLAAGDTQQVGAGNRNPTAPQESSHRHKTQPLSDKTSGGHNSTDLPVEQ